MPEPDALPNKCWHNVRQKCERDGGKAVNGWSVDPSINGIYRLVAHTVWESPDGTRIDITPSKYHDPFVECSMAGPGAPVAYALYEDTPQARANLARAQAFDKKEIEYGRTK